MADQRRATAVVLDFPRAKQALKKHARTRRAAAPIGQIALQDQIRRDAVRLKASMTL